MRIEHQNIHFASDFHIGHKNIIKFDNRPFSDVDEMHQVLINNWNSCVGKDDIVFYLGDFSFKNRNLAKWFKDKLNGKIYFIMGNHDRINEISGLGFEKVFGDSTALGGANIFIKDEDCKKGYQEITLCHYAILSWKNSHHGAWHLHGHSHQSLAKNPEMAWFYKRKVIDVGVNGCDYKPLSYKEVKKIMGEKVISPVDHHE